MENKEVVLEMLEELHKELKEKKIRLDFNLNDLYSFIDKNL